jgi:hypothetical protein
LAGIVIKIKSPPPVISTGGGLIIADFKDLLGQQPPAPEDTPAQQQVQQHRVVVWLEADIIRRY